MVAVCPASCNTRRFVVRACFVLVSVLLFSYCLSFVLFTDWEREQLYKSKPEGGGHRYTGKHEDIKVPVILWWTPFTKEPGRTKACGNRSCFFTEDRAFFNHTRLYAIVFYGSELEVGDLPLPRKANHDWALLHEESPKNNFLFCMPSVLHWFNHTATFSRNSDLPLTLQYLSGAKDLTSKEFFQETSKKNQARIRLAPIAYVQSDCNTPIERDAFVSELMNYIDVDSYGKCVHNRDLPEGMTNAMDAMDDKGFWHLLARYKFHLAVENYGSNDYITEKLWRPLIVGSVPIYHGSPSVADWLPNGSRSAVLISNYTGPKQLAEDIRRIDRNHTRYESFLDHKIHERISNQRLLNALRQRRWGANNDPHKPNFVEEFECLICERLWKRLQSSNIRYVADETHYSCEPPKSILKEHAGTFWPELFKQAELEARVLESLLQRNIPFGEADVQASVLELLQPHPTG